MPSGGENGPKRMLSSSQDSSISLWKRQPDLSLDLESRLTVVFENDDSGVNEEIVAQMSDFKWQISHASENAIEIAVEFAYPQVYSRGVNLQYLKVKAKFSDFEPGWDDDKDIVSIQIPTLQAEVSAHAAQAVSAAGKSTQAATAATLGVNIALSGAMSQVWGMINGMQLMVHLPLFDVSFPPLSQSMVENLITIATFDVMPSDDVLGATLDPPEQEQQNEKFQQIGFESSWMIVNLGTMFLTFVIMLFIPVLLLLIKPCRAKSHWLDKKYSSMMQALHGNMFIRYLMEGSLDISICIVLNFIQDSDSGGLQWTSAFHIVNNLAQIVFALAIMIFPAFVLFFYCKNFANWSNESFQERYGAVFEGLKTDSRASLAYPIVFVLRRIILVFVAIVTDQLFFVQLLSMVLISCA